MKGVELYGQVPRAVAVYGCPPILRIHQCSSAVNRRRVSLTTRSGGCRARRCALIGERLEAEQARQATVEKIEARPKLLARIGIHSGAVVVGAGGGFLLISTENEVRN